MKTIYCIQTFNKSGHHDSYADMYCNIFLDLGFRVILISNVERNNISTSLDKYRNNNLFFYYFNYNRKKKNKIKKYFFCKYINKIYSFISSKFLSYNIILPPFKYFDSSFNWPSCYTIDNIFKYSGFYPDLIFFLYLDPYFKNYSKYLYDLKYLWTGLLFNSDIINNYFLRKSISSSLCAGCFFIDHRYIQLFLNKFPKKHFYNLPDVPNTELSKKTPDFCNEIKKLSNGRKIILLTGSLDERKGIFTLLNIAINYPDSPFFFAFCGKLYWNSFKKATDNDKNLLKKCIFSPPNNCYFYTDYIENESEMNHLFLTADIIFAVYENFNLSSGIVGKATIFNKPIIVQKGGLMEHFVLKGPSGEVVESGNIIEIINILYFIINNNCVYNYNTYSNEITYDVLKEKINIYLNDLF